MLAGASLSLFVSLLDSVSLAAANVLVEAVVSWWCPSFALFGARSVFVVAVVLCCVVLCGMGPLCLLTSTFLTSPFARQVFYDFTDPKALYD